ncbi:MAG: hypothetical protein ACI4LM_06295, partial [Anaerovoracaceae bacterium]
KFKFGKRILALAAAVALTAGMAAPALSQDGRAFADTGSAKTAVTAAASASTDTEALKAAKNAYKQADSEYQALGFDFLNGMTSAGQDFATIRSAMEQDGAMSKYADEGLDKFVRSALKTDNLKKSVKFTREINKLRARSDNAYGSVSAVKIDPDLVMYSAFSGYVYTYTSWHDFFEADICSPSNLFGENLASGYEDPLDGWYTEEKEIYDADPNADYQKVGHYLHVVHPEAETVGLTYNDKVSAMDVGAGSTNDLTVDEFDEALTEFTKDAAEKRTAAKAEYDRVYKAYKARRRVAKVTQRKPKSGRGCVTVRWKKIKNADGYQINYGRGYWADRNVTVKGGSRTSKKIRIKKKRVYYIFYVRAYRIVDGRKFYGNWSDEKISWCW